MQSSECDRTSNSEPSLDSRRWELYENFQDETQTHPIQHGDVPFRNETHHEVDQQQQREEVLVDKLMVRKFEVK